MTNPAAFYRQRISDITGQRAVHSKRKRLLGWLRFFSFISAIVAAWLLWDAGMVIVLPAVLALLGLFLFLLAKDLDNNDTIENLDRLLKINRTEVDILSHHFTHLPGGSAFKP